MFSTSNVTKHRLSVDDRISFFEAQRKQWLSGARRGQNTNIHLVSKSGVVTSAHQAMLLPHSSYLKKLVETSESCGCDENVPTLLLPGATHQVIQATLDLLYSGIVIVTDDVMDELMSMIHDLELDLPLDKLIAEPLAQASTDSANHAIQLIGEPVVQSSQEHQVQSSVYQFEEPQVQPSVTVVKVNQSSESSANLLSSYQIVPQNEPSYAPSRTSSGESSEEKIKKVKVETEEINDERQKVRNKIKEVLVVLESVHDEASFIEITQPLESLLSNLKYLPAKSSFNSILPKEIKSKILGYLCNSGAVVAASVCQEWKEILEKRLVKMGELKIGMFCSNVYPCENNECFGPEDLLKASFILRLYDHIEICCPVPTVSAHILGTALTNVSTFSISNNEYSSRRTANDDYFSNTFKYHEEQLLTAMQQTLLLDCLENNESVKGIKLHGVAMDQVDQNRLIDCLFNSKIEKLMLRETVGSRHRPILNVSTMILRLKLFMIGPKLSQLNLGYLKYPDSLAVYMADALCQIKTVCLSADFPMKPETWKRLVQNILHGNIRMENLIIVKRIHWHNPMAEHHWRGDFSISCEDLKNVVSKLNSVFLRGCFQIGNWRSIKSLPGVDVESVVWRFGGESGITSQICKGIDSLDAYFCL